MTFAHSMILLWFQQSWSIGQIQLPHFSNVCRESTKERKRTRALIFPLILLFHLCEYFIPQVELLGYICSDYTDKICVS